MFFSFPMEAKPAPAPFLKQNEESKLSLKRPLRMRLRKNGPSAETDFCCEKAQIPSSSAGSAVQKSSNLTQQTGLPADKSAHLLRLRNGAHELEKNRLHRLPDASHSPDRKNADRMDKQTGYHPAQKMQFFNQAKNIPGSHPDRMKVMLSARYPS